MIKYILKCHNDHEFESWFSSSEEFEKLVERKLLECIYCLSKNIDKSIMSPMVSNSKSKNEEFDIKGKNLKNHKDNLLKLRKYIEKNFDYVGNNFSKKIREIYYDKKNEKAIYGTTTFEERKELSEEGIELLSIPWVNKDN